jgi:hypothetical protein
MAQIMLISFSRLENGQPYGKAYTRVSSIVFYLFISIPIFLSRVPMPVLQPNQARSSHIELLGLCNNTPPPQHLQLVL